MLAGSLTARRTQAVQDDPETKTGTILARWLPFVFRFNRHWYAPGNPRDKVGIPFPAGEPGATRMRDKIEELVVARNQVRQHDAARGATGKAGEVTPMDIDLDAIIDGRVGHKQLSKKLKGGAMAALQADAAAGAKVLNSAVEQMSGSDSGSAPPAPLLSKERLDAAKAARRASYAVPYAAAAGGGAAAGGDGGERAEESDSGGVFDVDGEEAPKPKKAVKRPRASTGTGEERKVSAREATQAGLSGFLQSVGASAGARAEADNVRARAAADKARAAVLHAEASLVRAQTEAHVARAQPAAPLAAPVAAPLAAPAAAPAAAQQDLGTVLAILHQLASKLEAQGQRLDALAPPQ